MLAWYLEGCTQAVPWPAQGPMAATSLVVCKQVQKVLLRDKLRPFPLQPHCLRKRQAGLGIGCMCVCVCQACPQRQVSSLPPFLNELSTEVCIWLSPAIGSLSSRIIAINVKFIK